MSRIGLFACFMVVAFATQCPAQVPSLTVPASPANSTPGSSPSPSIDRRIELQIRSRFSVPPDYELLLGGRTKSDVPGFDNLPVTLSYKGKQTVTDFLISTDGNTLARLEKFDLNKDPALAIDVDQRPVRGDAAAKVEIINFDDLECPYCARMNNELAVETLGHYKGLVKIVYKDYPLEEIHPWAKHAAVDANCLAALSAPAYWSYVDYVHSHGQDISGAQPDLAKSFVALDNIAGTFGTQNQVDWPKLAACLKKQDESVVSSSVRLGTLLRLEGTPQVFVNGERLPSGARPVEELWPAIDRALKAQGIQPPPEPPPPPAPPAGSAGRPGH